MRPGAVGTSKPHCAAERGGRRLGDRDAAGERGRVAAHLRAALHARVPADRHQPGARAADVAAREAEVHDRVHVLDAVLVLRDAHRPHEHRAAAPTRTSARSAPCRRAVAPDAALELVERLALELLEQRVEADVCSRSRTRGRAPPIASSCLSTPLTNATSPPVCTGKNSSVIFVPNIALSTFDGTQ